VGGSIDCVGSSFCESTEEFNVKPEDQDKEGELKDVRGALGLLTARGLGLLILAELLLVPNNELSDALEVGMIGFAAPVGGKGFIPFIV